MNDILTQTLEDRFEPPALGDADPVTVRDLTPVLGGREDVAQRLAGRMPAGGGHSDGSAILTDGWLSANVSDISDVCLTKI